MVRQNGLFKGSHYLKKTMALLLVFLESDLEMNKK